MSSCSCEIEDLKVEYGFSVRSRAYVGIQNVFCEGWDDYYQGYLPELRDVNLRRNNFQFSEPYLNVGIRGRF